MKSTLQAVKLYLLEFLDSWGQQRSIPVRMVDAANGVIFEETREGSGLFRFLSGPTGQEFFLLLPQVLQIKTYEVSFEGNARNGQRSCTQVVTESEVETIIRSRADSETGEVTGVRRIVDRDDPDNRVESKKP